MIEAQSVSKQYTSGRGHVRALSDISFSVAESQSFVLAGKSGSGKTTLLNCIGALEKPDNGRILYNGENICSFNPRQCALFQRKEIGFVFQTSNLIPWLTVAENLIFPMELNDIRGQEQRVRVQELLVLFDLAGYDKAMPGELSGGETQRISFARAIAHKPPLLLADEPTSHLDSATGQQLIELMLSLCASQHSTLIIATHDPELIQMTSSRIYLKDGFIKGRT